MIDTLVKKLLLADPGVSAQTSNRIYINHAPAGSQDHTYVVIQAPGVDYGEPHSDGQDNSQSGQVVVNCLAVSDDDANALKNDVVSLLKVSKGYSYLAREIMYIHVATSEPIEHEQEGDGLPKAYGYRIIADYII